MTRNHRPVAVVVIALTFALVAAACGSSSKTPSSSGTTSTTAAATAKVTCSGKTGGGGLALGGLMPQSGDLKVIYKSLCTPVQIAVDEINAAGGVHGKPVSLAYADDGTSPDAALKAARTQGGATVVANDAYDTSASDFHADVAKLVGKGADAVVVIGFNDDGAKILKEMLAQNIGPKQVQIYTADGMQSSSLGKSVDPTNPGIVQGIKGTALAAAPSGVTNPFIAKF